MGKKTILSRVCRRIRKLIGDKILYGRFPYAYMHYYYWKNLRKELNWNEPKDFNEKMFWLARYWQDPRIVLCADKLRVREYVKQLGLEHILTQVYAVYEKAEDIDFNLLPTCNVLKVNHLGGAIDCHL